MTETRTRPADCATMAEVRHGVDSLDREIVALLAERFRYMDAAARIKPNREAVRDEVRKAEVLRNVKSQARLAADPIERITALYDQLVELSIAYELETFDRIRLSD